MLLYIKKEVDDVSVLHNIFLALAAHQTLGLGSGHGAAFLHILEGDYLSPDEAPLEVGVNLAGGLGSLGAVLDGPGPALVGTGGEEGDEAQKGVAAANQLVET